MNGRDIMYWEIDFDSNEAIYLQLHHQVIRGIAAAVLREGDSLPSVRQLAEDIGINMHTVNKAYNLLSQEGFVRIDRRRGAIICLDIDRILAMEELTVQMRQVLARAICRNIPEQDVLNLVHMIYQEYQGQR